MTIIASCTNPIVFIVMSPPLKKRLNTMCQCLKHCGCCVILCKQASCCGQPRDNEDVSANPNNFQLRPTTGKEEEEPATHVALMSTI
ncbi:uncharacterized protein LOC142344664 [Convolutriloba macropyga]|uniref:uncharacterized protein LOC142344664 n=1 Tax=Convolutriloba macropyga TaxID=536237 RepID=UPI003F51E944